VVNTLDGVRRPYGATEQAFAATEVRYHEIGPRPQVLGYVVRRDLGPVLPGF